MSDCEISLPYLWEPADRNISRDQGLFIFLAKHRLWEGDGLCVQSLCWRDSRKPPENLLFSSLSFLLSLSLCLLLCSFTHSFFASSLIICLDVNSWSRDITFKTADDFKSSFVLNHVAACLQLLPCFPFKSDFKKCFKRMPWLQELFGPSHRLHCCCFCWVILLWQEKNARPNLFTY